MKQAPVILSHLGQNLLLSINIVRMSKFPVRIIFHDQGSFAHVGKLYYTL